ncbi:hypothetical protein CXB51_008362 [Gossypium anomalum]|uniref:Retrovirus-related Pol polyprotein from transposon TNT 1-94-like beta-barrel domain-containing protein n=1 Tax=Gossypium anomalum TaxID=47600 RepID=A0A8J6D3E9_9ROSI|nr:hypothetical protein CXB51_008362 [Gossypium anomalum]
MATTRFEIEKFDGETNFNLWQVQMMAILVQSGLKKEVLMEKTSFALWKRLETLYAIKSLANRLNVEVPIDDEDQTMLLLFSLPPSYKSFRETLIYGRDKLSFEDVNLGHVKIDCYKLRNKRAAESNEEDVVGANLTDENGDDFLLVSTSDNSKLTSEWILDSGCSFHMCPNREWLSKYSSVEGGVMRIGNDSSSKVIGIGTVKIKIHNGTIRILSDVRYVPDLRKNLISLSILDLKGCRINVELSGIKVSREALVFLKGKRTDSLYILEKFYSDR